MDKYVGRSAQFGVSVNDMDYNMERLINLVIEYTQCRRNRAINALYLSNNDVVQAIMSIQHIPDI